MAIGWSLELLRLQEGIRQKRLKGKPIINLPRPHYSPLYDYMGLIEACKKSPRKVDSLDEIVKHLGLPIFDSSDHYSI